MLVKLKNIHRVVVAGKVYLYHRPTRTRLTEAPGSPEFVARVTALNKAARRPRASAARLDGLLKAYRTSPEYAALAHDTKRLYERNLRWLDAIGDMPLADVDGPFVIGLRDRVFKKHSRVQANQMVSLVRSIWLWGRPRGLTKGMPTDGIREIPRPKGLPIKNRRWKGEEVDAFIRHCRRPDVALAVLLGVWTSLRVGDIIALRWEDLKDGTIIQSKTGEETYINLPAPVRDLLDAQPRETEWIIPNGSRQHTSGGFSTIFWRIAGELEEAGHVGPGLTFHGLRHTVASDLADAGAHERTIMAMTGHRSASSVKRYTAQADRRRHSKAAAEMLEAVKEGVKMSESAAESTT